MLDETPLSFHAVTAGYGTSDYGTRPWKSMTDSEWISTGSIDYTFTEPGKYIVVVWVTDDTVDYDVKSIPIIGWSMDIE